MRLISRRMFRVGFLLVVMVMLIIPVFATSFGPAAGVSEKMDIVAARTADILGTATIVRAVVQLAMGTTAMTNEFIEAMGVTKAPIVPIEANARGPGIITTGITMLTVVIDTLKTQIAGTLGVMATIATFLAIGVIYLRCYGKEGGQRLARDHDLVAFPGSIFSITVMYLQYYGRHLLLTMRTMTLRMVTALGSLWYGGKEGGQRLVRDHQLVVFQGIHTDKWTPTQGGLTLQLA